MRWKNDRIRKKKARDKRKAQPSGEGGAAAATESNS